MTAAELRELHSEDNKVYYHPKIGFYTVIWEDGGNSDIPHITLIDSSTEKLGLVRPKRRLSE